MKINNKIIRLKRFAKSICHCERSAAILFALVLVLSLGIMAVPMAGTVMQAMAQTDSSITLGTTGDGIAEWSTDEAQVGSYSVKLQWPAGDRAYVSIDLPSGATINNSATWSYWIDVSHFATSEPEDYVPNLTFYLDTTGDTNSDTTVSAWPEITHEEALAGWYQIDETTIGGYKGAYVVWGSGPAPSYKFSWGDVQAAYGTATILKVKIGKGVIGTGENLAPCYIDDLRIDVVTYEFEPCTDATLSDLTVDGTTISGFSPSTLTYNKELPYGTTEVPAVGATPTDSNATKVITQAENVTGTEAERTATVVVTAEDGTTQKTYEVIFSVAANTDATLSDLTLNGTTVTGFDPATLSYNVELPYGTETVPTVAATPTDSNATKVITQAENVTGTEVERTATVVVTAEDGTTTKTYKVIFGSINVTVTKTGPATANQGNNITYTITYKNEGTFNATNVVITETYPSEVEYVSANPAPDSGTNNQWTIGTLAPDAEGTITVTVHIK
jgi:uncharacterized repeat protein (TIGR01451 family)